MAKFDIKYVIVHDDGVGKSEFLELFGSKWGVINSYATGNAVHYIMKPIDDPTAIVMPEEDRALVHNFGKKRQK